MFCNCIASLPAGFLANVLLRTVLGLVECMLCVFPVVSFMFFDVFLVYFLLFVLSLVSSTDASDCPK